MLLRLVGSPAPMLLRSVVVAAHDILRLAGGAAGASVATVVDMATAVRTRPEVLRSLPHSVGRDGLVVRALEHS